MLDPSIAHRHKLPGVQVALADTSREGEQVMARQRARRGGGSIFEAYAGFYLRAYIDGKQKTFRLCDKNDANYSTKAKVVKELAAKKISELHAVEAAPESPTNDMRVADFYEQHFLPFLKSNVATGNTSAATLRFYEGYWQSYMRDHFGDTTLLGYSAGKGTNFLTELARQGKSRSTLQNARALGSAIFKYAIRAEILGENVLVQNPFQNVGSLVKAKPVSTQPYSLREINSIIVALGNCTVDHTNLKHHAVEPHAHLEAQLFMALTFFDGLRPSEANGLRWEDIRDGKIFVSRSLENGISGKTKTLEAQAPVPIADAVLPLLMSWHASEGKPESGWLFHHHRNLEIALNRNNLGKRVIRPCVEEAGLVWKAFRAGRSGVATEITELSGNLVAAKELLRHKRITTTARYQRKTEGQAALTNGMRQLAALSNGGEK